MAYTATEKNDAMTGRRDRLNDGTLRLLGAGGELVATVALSNPCGTVAGSTLTFADFPKSATILLTGTAIASAALRRASAVDSGTGYTVGLAGSGAQVILSKLTPAVGDTLSISSLTIADA